VLVGRGVLRNPWILAQAADLAAGLKPRELTLEDRGSFLLDYIDLLLNERVHDAGACTVAELMDGRRSDDSHGAASARAAFPAAARSHDRWVINKVRALGSWYTKGLEGGSRLRTEINSAESLPALRDILRAFFFAPANVA
jgi:tRNA-dihydrouridine synthase